MANLLADAVDICRWLDADGETPYEARLARDRSIGRELGRADDLTRVLAWWDRLRDHEAGDTGAASLGRRLVALSRLATWLLALLGLLLGASLGSVAFSYDGTHPVNLLGLLGVLVGVPFLLLLLTLIFLLPVRIPGLAVLREGIGVINPGRWAGAWLDHYAGMQLFGGFTAGRTRFARWQLVVFSQWLAVGYFLGVLGAGMVLVAVTDLAFGWSTTLDLDAHAVARTFGVLALPWQGWLPSAVPDLALVEASRFYRLETAAVGKSEAMQLGAWWPFVLCTILVWGLLPRLLLLGLGGWRLGAATRALICQDPEVLALLDRLTPPRVDFGPEEEGAAPETPGGVAAPPQPAADSRSVAVIWNRALETEAAGRWGRAYLGGAFGRILELSSRSGPAEIEAALAGAPEVPGRVVIFTKGWEPPLLEFGDFLRTLRGGLGTAAVITVVPIDTRGEGVSSADRQVWAGFLAKHDDPRLYVQQATTTAKRATTGDSA
ncbi:MAG: DUF2868 domain-containing protein [Pseudomonadales bacterium]